GRLHLLGPGRLSEFPGVRCVRLLLRAQPHPLRLHARAARHPRRGRRRRARSPEAPARPPVPHQPGLGRAAAGPQPGGGLRHLRRDYARRALRPRSVRRREGPGEDLPRGASRDARRPAPRRRLTGRFHIIRRALLIRRRTMRFSPGRALAGTAFAALAAWAAGCKPSAPPTARPEAPVTPTPAPARVFSSLAEAEPELMALED